MSMVRDALPGGPRKSLASKVFLSFLFFFIFYLLQYSIQNI